MSGLHKRDEGTHKNNTSVYKASRESLKRFCHPAENESVPEQAKNLPPEFQNVSATSLKLLIQQIHPTSVPNAP